ncbi:dipeptidase D [Alkalispirochaeta americana]|uniref:Cytosol non-specific dipeptidase n=1 Tax=Alkalispirochaeta americana TaxID=159291 RepID=A0A1N6NEW8_9SPIO|nr:aminoacyl-histidine dipeptidase [Alkalispirochaeta americana]SIP90592.1 dipeptidase D [Alkalispirochaeta americana]
MSSAIDGLKPKEVWNFFAEISAIPRESRKEEKIRNYVLEKARLWGLPSRSDTIGNVVVEKPASPGFEHLPVTVLQGHLDMVCEQNRGTGHNFDTDGIELVRQGEWLRANNTTLGADNGIAVAMMLALLESDEPLGPLECLFTVDEETGLTGALEMDPSLIKGRILINLDSEEEGYFYIGCAGGCNTYMELPLVRESFPQNSSPEKPARGARLEITGLQGGHSGMDIHEGRGNSLVLGARLLAELRQEFPALMVSRLSGGGKHNAIPRELVADLAWAGVKGPDFDQLQRRVADWEKTFRQELGSLEPGLKVSLKESELPELVLTPACCDRVINLLLAIPQGVLGMSHDVPGLVETSNNLAAVDMPGDRLLVLTSQRSSRNTLIDWAGRHVAAPARLAGAEVRVGEWYPAWTPNAESPLLERAVQVYRDLRGQDPQVKAVHAGLECGVIRDRVGEMDMISLGPDLVGVHTPEEKLHIASTERTWEFLLKFLQALG